MRTIILRSQFHFPKLTNLTPPSANPPFRFHISPTSQLKYPTKQSSSHFSSQSTILPRQNTDIEKTLIYEVVPKSQKFSGGEFFQVIPAEYSRIVILGAVSLGLALFLMGIDDQKALALGPEGPLMEEFWDNMRRYALYALTVSTGFAYTLFEPIFELLKNPISAILILTIIGGSVFIVSQVVSAMVGVTDFNYEYGY
ncbi:unnamed protein product [Ilex paraguariensis]|uniref:Uncharacterized protein ycf33 n=1 Tax=Ilex paraguariensis TaxID=185542 RepID=A0ABC8SHY8_9AQUA